MEHPMSRRADVLAIVLLPLTGVMLLLGWVLNAFKVPTR